jgi:hypothetical protein
MSLPIVYPGDKKDKLPEGSHGQLNAVIRPVPRYPDMTGSKM